MRKVSSQMKRLAAVRRTSHDIRFMRTRSAVSIFRRYSVYLLYYYESTNTGSRCRPVSKGTASTGENGNILSRSTRGKKNYILQKIKKHNKVSVMPVLGDV